MNPDTEATTELFRLLCTRHNIPYRSHRRITTGFTHELHRLNTNLEIKFFNSDDSRNFKTESAVLQSDIPFPKPRLIAVGEKNQVIDRNYIIMSYVESNSLGSIWHLATDQQREELIKTICLSLKGITKLDSSIIGLKIITSWQDYILERIEALTCRLQSKNIIDTIKRSKYTKNHSK